jgi:hypothetical protein
VVEVRTRGRVGERALRGVGVESRAKGKEVVVEKDKDDIEGRQEEAAGDGDERGEHLEESPRKRQRVGEGGESVAVTGPEPTPARRRPNVTRTTGTASKRPTKRPIEDVAPETKPRIYLHPVSKPPIRRPQLSALKHDRSRTVGGTRPASNRPPRSSTSSRK